MEAPKATDRGDWSRLSASVSCIWGTASLGGYKWAAVGETGWLVGGVSLWLLAGPQAGVSLVLCQGGLSHRAEAALPKQGLKHPRKCVVLFSMEFRPSSGLLGEVRIWEDRDGEEKEGPRIHCEPVLSSVPLTWVLPPF